MTSGCNSMLTNDYVLEEATMLKRCGRGSCLRPARGITEPGFSGLSQARVIICNVASPFYPGCIYGGSISMLSVQIR